MFAISHNCQQNLESFRNNNYLKLETARLRTLIAVWQTYFIFTKLWIVPNYLLAKKRLSEAYTV